MQVLVRLPVTDHCFHVCEIQLHLTAVKQFDKEQGSHAHYEYFRKYFEGAMDTVTKRLADLQEVVGEPHAGTVDLQADMLTDNLTQLLTNVMASNNKARIKAAACLMSEYLCEYELAECLFRHLAEMQTDDEQPGDARNSLILFSATHSTPSA